MSSYHKRKAAAREFAIMEAERLAVCSAPLDEIVLYQWIFERLGRRYGLIREFRENGII